MIWNSTQLAQDLLKSVKQKIDPKQPPGLAIIRVGDDPSSKVYVRIKQQAAENLGMHIIVHKVPSNTATNELLQQIDTWNNDPKIDGILVQLPLPAHIDCNAVLNRVAPHKDVDGISAISQGLLWNKNPLFVPCTPQGVLSLLKHYNFQLAGIRTTIVGDSRIVGRPMAACLLNHRATVTICHKETKELSTAVSNAELLIVGIGCPGVVQSSWIKNSTTVIDIGINKDAKNRITGDIDFQSLHHRVKNITPVPGGVGPMTVVSLMENTLKAHQRNRT